jgi:hypothetical protein
MFYRLGKIRGLDMFGLGAEHVQQTTLKPGLGGRICLDFPGKIGYKD